MHALGILVGGRNKVTGNGAKGCRFSVGADGVGNHAMHRVASCYLYYLGGRSTTAALAFGSVDVYI